MLSQFSFLCRSWYRVPGKPKNRASLSLPPAGRSPRTRAPCGALPPDSLDESPAAQAEDGAGAVAVASFPLLLLLPAEDEQQLRHQQAPRCFAQHGALVDGPDADAAAAASLPCAPPVNTNARALGERLSSFAKRSAWPPLPRPFRRKWISACYSIKIPRRGARRRACPRDFFYAWRGESLPLFSLLQYYLLFKMG